jgi:hypothetical protein
LPRIARGDAGAIRVLGPPGESALLRAARLDLETALRSFGHPIVHGAVASWRRLDRRFRRTATIAWFAGREPERGIAINAHRDGPASIRTHGAVSLEVPWLPCAAAARADTLALLASIDPASAIVGVVGTDADVSALAARGLTAVRVTPEMLLGEEHAQLACVAHFGYTDEAAFGNVLLAATGLPAVIAGGPLERLFAPDVALVRDRHAVAETVAELAADPERRARLGRLLAADARRRFSPRRTAIRIVDLLCASRFGLERPGAARTNTPL